MLLPVNLRLGKNKTKFNRQNNIGHLVNLDNNVLRFLDRPMYEIAKDIKKLTKEKTDNVDGRVYELFGIKDMLNLMETIDTIITTETTYNLEVIINDRSVSPIGGKDTVLTDIETRLSVLEHKPANLLYALSKIIIMLELQRPDLDIKKLIYRIEDFYKNYFNVEASRAS